MALYNFGPRREDCSVCTIKYFAGEHAVLSGEKIPKAWRNGRSVSGITYHKFYYNISGEGVFSVNGKEYKIEPGYLYFIPKNTYQTFLLTSDFLDQYYLHFDIEISYLEKNSEKGMPVCVECDKDKVVSLFEGIIQLGKQRNKNVLRRSIALAELFDYYLACAEKAKESELIIADDRQAEIMKFTRENYKNKITSQDMSRHLHLNHAYFIRYFKKTFKTTPTEFINKYRTDRAMLLLYTTDESVSSIAAKCGFESYSYFARLFKKYNDLTPLEYRNSRGKS